MCPLCRDIYQPSLELRRPHILPCGHSVCRDCLGESEARELSMNDTLMPFVFIEFRCAIADKLLRQEPPSRRYVLGSWYFICSRRCPACSKPLNAVEFPCNIALERALVFLAQARQVLSALEDDTANIAAAERPATGVAQVASLYSRN